MNTTNIRQISFSLVLGGLLALARACIRSKKVVIGLVTLASLGLLVGPAAALHGGAIVDCGATGTFTLKTTSNGAGFESPPFAAVLLFEEGGTLSILKMYRDGQLVWDPAAVGMAHNNGEEVNCSFTLKNGVHIEVTGVYTGP